jgi:hypothetical protein
VGAAISILPQIAPSMPLTTHTLVSRKPGAIHTESGEIQARLSGGTRPIATPDDDAAQSQRGSEKSEIVVLVHEHALLLTGPCNFSDP